MKDWKDWEKEMESVINGKLSGLETQINDKVLAYVSKLVEDNEKKFREKTDKKDGKPVYEYRANGFVTSVFPDGTKIVVPEDKKEKKSSSGDPGKEKTKGDKILGMVPFLDEESLHELTVQFLDGNLEIEMREVLPFLEEEDVALLLNRITENGEPFKGLELYDVLPFADEEDVGEIFKKKAKEGIIDEGLIDYVDEDCWHEIVRDYCDNENSGLDIDKIYPHLDEDDLKLLFKTYLKRQK